MGYQVVFKPTEEAMEKYSPKELGVSYTTSEDEITALIVYCMSTVDNAVTITSQVKLFLNVIEDFVRKEEKLSTYNQWKDEGEYKGTVWFCGWQYAKPCEYDLPTIKAQYIRTLSIMATCIKTPDYFENSELFFEKVNVLEEEIGGFIDAVKEIQIHEIIEDLNEFKDTEEDE